MSATIISPSVLETNMEFPLPKIFKYTISSGDILYSIMYEPPNMDVKKKYPVVLNIYGGPEVQLVTNTFKVYALHYIICTIHIFLIAL
jgi:dipeptidyl-peptidase 9